MTDLREEIIRWLHGQQDWLQDAAERLLAVGSLSEADIKALAGRVKTAEGQKITTNRTFDSLAGVNGAAADLRLVEIGDISGIENLEPRKPLGFGSGNLAVIYGGNGSGKSGYTRILKRACGHPRAVELKPNVFQDYPPSRQCKITYSLAGVEYVANWQAEGDAMEDLRSIDVFDSDVAAFYLTRETEATYAPPSIVLFEDLAAVCERVKTQLQAEQGDLKCELPMLPAECAATPIGWDYRSLKPSTTEKTIDLLTKWTDHDQGELDQLTERLKTSNPALLARQKRRTKTQLENLVEQMRNAAAAVSAEQLEVVRKAREEAKKKRRMATEAAQVGTAKFEAIGTDTWNALWEAARAYSQTVYPEKCYPVTEDGSRCVLCHQELDPESQQRLRDFETFVQGAVEADAKAAEEAYRQAQENLPSILNDEAIRMRCEAAGLAEDGWAGRLGGFWNQVGKACDCLRSGEVEDQANAVQSPDQLLAELTQRAEELEREAAQNDEDAKGFDREAAGKDKLNLEARRWAAQQAKAIHGEILRLKELSKYEYWKKLANSRPISIKAGVIAKKAVTQAYVDRFNEELRRLGAARIRVELVKTRTQHGIALHQIKLKGVTMAGTLPEAILSEGERRIVSLAGFLADVAENPHSTPFIFDDPISSLDHDFEWSVAVRLTQLAQERQVLVFTHRLLLYGALEDAAKKVGDVWKKNNLEQRCIESFGGAAGHPADQAAWNANTKAANNILLTRLDEAKKAGKTDGAGAYRMHAQGICTDFRKLLERTVEDDLLNAIVKRHRRSVTTDNRLAPLPHIEPDDCTFIDGLMTKYSAFEHSQSLETPVTIPDEAELREDLESLKVWREEFKKRPTVAGI